MDSNLNVKYARIITIEIIGILKTRLSIWLELRKINIKQGRLITSELLKSILSKGVLIAEKKRLGKRTDGVSTLVRGGYSWLTIKKEIDKCEVRCRNCHKKKTWKEQNYFSDMKDFIDSKIKKDGTK